METRPLNCDPEDVVEVVNRTNQEYKTMFNAKPITFKPNEVKHMLYKIAINICVGSYNSIQHPTGIPQHYKLAIRGMHDCSPLQLKEQVEVLDRSGSEKLRHSEPKILSQGDVKDMGIGKFADDANAASPSGITLPHHVKTVSRGKSKKRVAFKKTKTLAFDNAPTITQTGAGGAFSSAGQH